MTQKINLQKDAVLSLSVTDAAVTGSEVKDNTPNRHHMTVHGGATLVNSPFGSALDFDGDDDRLELSDQQSIKPGNEVTIHAIVRSDSAEDVDSEWLDKGASQSDGPYGGELNTYRNSVDDNWNMKFQDSNNNRVILEATSPNKYEWETMSFVFDNGNAYAIVGGDVADTTTTPNSDLINAPYPLRIGARADYISGLPQHTEFQTAFVGIWHRALNETELELLHTMKGPMVQQL